MLQWDIRMTEEGAWNRQLRMANTGFQPHLEGHRSYVPPPDVTFMKARYLVALGAFHLSPLQAQPAPTSITRPAESVVANDNRTPAGARRGGRLELRLVAQHAAWRPNERVDSTITVLAFAEEGRAARIPGPLVRAHSGTEIRIRLRNALPDTTSTLVVHGLRAGPFESDTLQLAPGATREVTWTAGAPGTYVYWGTTTKSPIHDRPVRDGQLTGAIVIDPPGARPDTAERIFVMTVLDLYPDDTLRNRKKEDVFDRAINGKSWPYTERLRYTVGDTVRWRWINGSYLPHPMHLHGFHFDVTARGEKNADTTYSPGHARTVVTEFMVAGSSFRMRWVPTRGGHWLMHCHMLPHVTPFPNRPDSARAHVAHDLERHAREAMQGLVLGIQVIDRPGVALAAASLVPMRRLRLFAQQARADSGKKRAASGYVLQRGTAPRADSVEVPGSPLVLTRGETTAITVVNRLDRPTTVHWHGMELESAFDGVAGWSRTGSTMAPLVAPGDSFTVSMTPPRAGTFIYHTHMDENGELSRGMYGPLIVLEPGQRFDPATDLVFMFGSAIEGDSARKVAINGRADPAPIAVRVGISYRLRLVNIHSAGPASVDLRAPDSTLLSWTPIAKDGADLAPHARVQVPARMRRFGAGETWDLEWTPAVPGDVALSVVIEGVTRRQLLRVRDAR